MKFKVDFHPESCYKRANSMETDNVEDHARGRHPWRGIL